MGPPGASVFVGANLEGGPVILFAVNRQFSWAANDSVPVADGSTMITIFRLALFGNHCCWNGHAEKP